MFKGKEQKQEKNKGITLIALVITIIVMLILVAVTITMAINGGLFENAGRAVGETENAIDREQALANGGIEVDGIQYNSIDDYIAGNPTPIHNWTREGDTFTCSHCDATYTMGDVVNYTPKGNTTAIITAEKSGYSSDQTIKKQDATWMVLGIEDTDGNGTNETLLITTHAPIRINESNNKLYLHGAEAYNNGPSEINRICEELYSNSEYGKARGMTIEDVNNALNVDLEEFGLGGMCTDDGGTWKTTGNLTTKLKELTGDTYSNIWETIVSYNKINREGVFYTPAHPEGIGSNEQEENEGEKELGEYLLNGYAYELSNGELINPANSTKKITPTEIETAIIFGTSNNYSYWLASRGVRAYSDYAFFGPGVVGYGEAYSYIDTFFSDGNEGSPRAALRPVVSLTSKIPAIVEYET